MTNSSIMASKSPHKLVIFDMDGTLINSESIAERAWAHASEHLARRLTPEEVNRRFRGRTMQVAIDEITEENGGSLPEAFFESLSTYWEHAIQTELQPTEGAVVLLEKLMSSIDICVASNGQRHNVVRSLDCAGLLPFFEGRLFSASDVKNPKPDAEMYLKAAAHFGVQPTECIVLEDSTVGLTAARNAGMDAVGFFGHDPSSRDELASFGFPVTDTIGDLLEFVRLP